MKLPEFDKKLDDYCESLIAEFDSYVDVIESKLNSLPPELRINIMIGIIVTKLAEYISRVRDNALGIEAAGLKKVLLNFITELDKTNVPSRDIPIIKAMTND